MKKNNTCAHCLRSKVLKIKFSGLRLYGQKDLHRFYHVLDALEALQQNKSQAVVLDFNGMHVENCSFEKKDCPSGSLRMQFARFCYNDQMYSL